MSNTVGIPAMRREKTRKVKGHRRRGKGGKDIVYKSVWQILPTSQDTWTSSLGPMTYHEVYWEDEGGFDALKDDAAYFADSKFPNMMESIKNQHVCDLRQKVDDIDEAAELQAMLFLVTREAPKCAMQIQEITSNYVREAVEVYLSVD